MGYNIFPHFLLTYTVFQINIFSHKMRVWFSLKPFSETCFIARKTRKVERELTKNTRKSSCRRALFLVRFTRNLNFPDTFEKYSSTKFHEIPSMCTDRRTDTTKLIFVFRNSTHLIRSHFFWSIFSQKHRKCQITQVGNFVEIHPLAVALKQADGTQRNKMFAICFESRIMETELNEEK